ncbi:hypothetical protein PC39_03462 [Salinisphaera sp. PC39]|uniref:hypothetical protein n=1 Tax=Salinisphaera sp. PC39 TaxID=1304156 RepID=UPI00333F0F63
MKINIEIDVTPAELRHFLGLPDVAGLQEDMIDYIRGRVSRGAEGFDPADLIRDTTEWGNKTLQRLLSMAASRMNVEDDDEPADDGDEPGGGKTRSRRGTGGGQRRGRGGGKKA